MINNEHMNSFRCKIYINGWNIYILTTEKENTGKIIVNYTVNTYKIIQQDRNLKKKCDYFSNIQVRDLNLLL